MSYVVCCCTIEVRYQKKAGGCKVVNDNALQVSEVDTHLNEIMKKSHFGEFISVKLTNIHERPLQSAGDTDSSDDEEEAEVGNEVPRSVSPVVDVGQ